MTVKEEDSFNIIQKSSLFLILKIKRSFQGELEQILPGKVYVAARNPDQDEYC